MLNIFSFSNLSSPPVDEKSFQEKKITGVIFIDLSAAYDTINHNLLLSKLQKLTSDSKLVKTIETILRNRRIFVTLEKKKTDGGVNKMVYPKIVCYIQPYSIYTLTISLY